MNQFWQSLNANPEGKLILTAVILLAVFVIIWLLLRNLRLWYWKTDQVIEKLDRINHRINEMEENIDKIKIGTEIMLNRDVRYLEPSPEKEALEEGQGNALPEREAGRDGNVSGEEDGGQMHQDDTELSENTAEEKKQTDPQLHRLEEALKELQRQKEQLETDLNAKIRF